MSNILSPNASGVTLYLPLSEGSGSVAYDYSVNSNDGTLVNTPLWNKESDGSYSIAFNGSNQYISVSGFSMGDTFTIGGWFKVSDLSSNNFVWSGGGTSTNRYPDIIITPSASILARANDRHSGCSTVDGAYSINAWVFIVFTGTGHDSYLYVNGEFIESYNNSTYPNVFYSSVNIGRRGDNTGYTTGRVRFPFVRNTIITPEEVKKLYQDTYIK